MLLATLLACSLATTDELRLPVRVLYAGNESSPYTDAYVKFLGDHAKSVRSLALSSFRRGDLADVDVLVVGGEVEVKDEKGEFQSLRGEKIGFALDDLQGFPVVLIGGQGGFVSDAFELKTSWSHG